MVEQAAQDYANIIRSINPASEINPLCLSIEDMLTRLDEFESLLLSVKSESNDILENNIASILAFGSTFEQMRQRIDKLEQLVNVVAANVEQVEESLDIAEKELNITDYSLKGLLWKPLLAKTAKVSVGSDDVVKSNLENGKFKAVPVFDSKQYFDETNISEC